MSLGVTADQLELGATLRAWAAGLDGPAVARAEEGEASADVAKVWAEVSSMELPVIGVDEERGGGGGTLVDQQVALEAAAHALLPGPLLATALVARLASAAGAHDVVTSIVGGDTAAVVVGGEVALDPVGARWLLAEVAGTWTVLDQDGWSAAPRPGIDLTRRAGTVEVTGTGTPMAGVTTDQVRHELVALAAAEAAGIARWCLDTAVSYAQVREQFGRPIGSFQAVKHLCAEMLEATESVAAVAWDAGQAPYAADVAAVVAFDGAVSVAQSCIQVLGGIGFTFEHDAHLYLRRAMALRTIVGAATGGAGGAAVRLAERARAGERREIDIDLGGDDGARAETRARLDGATVLPVELQMPHLPEPYGVAAGPVEQLVIDTELERVGLTRPDIKIGGWAVPTIVAHGTDDQRERFVLPTLRGDITWCQLFSEPGAGSDLASLSTRAERVDGGWSLTGQKVWTSLAHEADWAICLARTTRDAKPHQGITYFCVDMTAAGIDIRPLREMTGDAMFNEVFLDAVFVPDDCVVGEVDDGWRLTRTTLSSERVAMASSKLGLSTERAVQLLGAEASPLDAARVGRQVALATVCQLLGVRSTLRSIAGQGAGPESSVAKLLGVRNRQEASDLVVDLLGPAVLTGEHAADVHEALLTRCLSIAGGTTQILRNVAAERILGLPRG